MTPEAKIKNKINKLLYSFGEKVYFFMPVPSGYGRSSIDYLLCVDGLFVGLEAKKPKGKPTLRQQGVLEDIRAAGGSTFVIDDDDDIEALDKFIRAVLLQNLRREA